MARLPALVLLAAIAAGPAAAQPAPEAPPSEVPPPPPEVRTEVSPEAAPPPPPPARGQGGLVDALAAPDPPPAEDSAGVPVPPVSAGCPREALAALFRTVVDTDDVVTALALERETLALCLDRARLETQLREAETRIAADAAPPEAPPSAPAPEAADLVAQLGAPPAAALPASAPEGEIPPAPAPSGEEPPPVAPAPLRWFTIIGSGGALRAGVSDGTDVWFVSEGDTLRDAEVRRIRARPPGVVLADGRELPWLGDPPAGAPAAETR